ncbi:MAG: glycosyltransferase family 2 protein [Chloroflexota bacterium]
MVTEPIAQTPIAILTWRGEATTRRCLESLRGRTGFPAGIVVVDNGSGTGEGERLATEFGVEAVTLEENGGVAAGYNAAITWALAAGASHVLLSNNDLEFPDADLADRLTRLVEPGVAAVGPMIRNVDGSVWNAGGRLRPWLGHAIRTSMPWQPAPYAVDWLDGACLLVSIDAVCRIGGLAPEFFLYWEETDWSARARRAGLRLLVDPSAEVLHVGWGSGTARQTRRYSLRNSLLFVRRDVGGPAGISAGLLWLLGRVPWFVVKRLREGGGVRGPVADAAWAIGWHLRSVARHGWRVPADGPDLCE